MEQKTMEFEIKEADAATGVFTGYGSVFGNIDHGFDIVKRGAFKTSLKQQKQTGRMPAMLWSHERDRPIGQWMEMREDSHGLWVKGALWVSGNTMGAASVPEAERARNMMISNGPKGLSIGFRNPKSNLVQKQIETTDGRKIEVMVREIKDLNLMEISPVVFAMNEEAEVDSVKGLQFDQKRVIEKALMSAGFTNEQAKALLAEGWAGLKRDADNQHQKRDVEEQLIANDLDDLLNTINKSM